MGGTNEVEFIPIAEVTDHIPGHPSRATVWRWILHGVRGHRLESMFVGGRRYVTPHAIDRWLEAINDRNSFTPANQKTLRERNALAAHEAIKSKVKLQ